MSRRRARIEIIPLIDIIFFLLATFVMLSLSMVKNQGVTVALPASTFKDEGARTPPATVTVAADGAVYYDTEKVSEDQLAARLRELKSKSPDPIVWLNGDRKVPFGRSIAVLDLLRVSGITQISIRTQPAGKAR